MTQHRRKNGEGKTNIICTWWGNMNRIFKCSITKNNHSTGKYCSRSCVAKARVKKGIFPTLGIKYSNESREKISKNHADFSAEKNPNWKGDKVGNCAVHHWIKKLHGFPKKCELCGTTDSTKKYEWANITGKYKRDIENWKRACISCHRKFDHNKPEEMKLWH